MKKLTLLFITTILLFYSCNNNSSNSTNESLVFSGKIEIPNSNKLNILDINQDVVKSIILDEDGTFSDTLNLKEGFYSLFDGKESTTIYLKPKFNLNLTLNTKKFDESIKYSGEGANENNYLAQKALLRESFGQLNYYSYYAKLTEKEFLKVIDSLYNVEKTFLEKAEGLNENFKNLEAKSLEFSKLTKYSSFEDVKRYRTDNKDFKVSDSFPDAFANINLSDEKLVVVPNYLFYVQTYLRHKNREKNKDND